MKRGVGKTHGKRKDDPSFLRLSWLTPTEILDGIQVGDYNKMDYGNSNVAGKMRRSDGRTDDKEYDGIWQM